MPDLTHGEGRPATNGTALENPTNPAPSVPDLVEVRHDDDTSPFALVLAGVPRRRVFFGLPAAEKALARARSRGELGAHLELVRLQHVVTFGGGLDD